MKKFFAMILAVILLATQCLALAENTEENVYTNLRVGNVNPLHGQFFTGMWGNATADDDVRSLIHGYNLVYWDGENGMFAVNPSVVTGAAVTEDEEGNRNFILVLADDLYYSDGTRITAWDYAFSFLLTASPEIEKIGGTPARSGYILGSSDYTNGTVKEIAGVRVVEDDSIIITIDHNYLPFFYEMALLMCEPYPIHVLAPGVTVRDDGNGVYLDNENENVATQLFNAELLERTILDPDDGYLSHPSVVCGPYTLTSFDGTTAEFAINPYFKGNAKGQLPSIPTLTLTKADYETMIDQLTSGEIDALNKVMRADVINEGLAAMAEGGIAMSNYARSGLSFIGFDCTKETVGSEAVRQAIAWCMDREQIVADYTGAFGIRADGYYGIGQWMYGIIAQTTQPPVQLPEDENDAEAMAAYQAELDAYAELNLDGLTVYEVDTEKAAELLEADGWKLNEDGIREKDGVKLELKLIYSEATNIDETLQANLIPNLEAVGIRMMLEPVSTDELYAWWYKQSDRKEADAAFLATNFDIVFDPAVNFRESEEGKLDWAYTGLNDDLLYADALAMRTTEPGDVLTYLQNWISFQERFNEILPMIPIYTNVYFDFYTEVLRNYTIGENTGWGEAIVGAYMSDEEPELMEDAEEFLD